MFSKPFRRSTPHGFGQWSAICIIALLFAAVLAGAAFGADAPKDQNRVALKNIIVDKIKKEVRIKSTLAITEGILEYLLVHEQGKAYESALGVSDNKPSELNFALLLIGCKPLSFETLMKLTQEQKDVSFLLQNHRESLVEIEIHRDGRKVGYEYLLTNREGTPIQPTWVFTGGFFTQDNRYVGDLELSHIGIWPDPSAPINLYSTMGNPYRGNFGLEMNRTNKALKVGQEYDIVIRRKE